MARIRSIKPGFFINERLADVPAEARLLFIALWCHADRDGRLEDNPRRLKSQVFSYDPCTVEDVNGWLDDLAGNAADPDSQFIVRYQSAGRKYIQIVTFGKHQTPHIREAESVIPAPPKDITPSPSPSNPDQDDTEDEQAAKKATASPVQAPVKHGASPVQESDGHHSSQACMGNGITGMGSGSTRAQARTHTRDESQILATEPTPVGVWQDVFDQLLPIRQIEVIETEKIQDLDTWREVLVSWRANSYSVKNISGMVDSYKRRIKLQSEHQAKQKAGHGANVVNMPVASRPVNQTPGLCNTCFGNLTVPYKDPETNLVKGRKPCPKCAVQQKTA